MKGKWTDIEIQRLVDVVARQLEHQKSSSNNSSNAGKRFNWSLASQHVRSRTPAQCFNKLRYLMYRSPSLFPDKQHAEGHQDHHLSTISNPENVTILSSTRSPTMKWTPEQDALVLKWGKARESSKLRDNDKEDCHEYENLTWTELAKRLSRTPHACNQRYTRLQSLTEFAKSGLRSQTWSRMEDTKLLHAFTRNPYDWTNIASQVGSRSAQQCYQRYFSLSFDQSDNNNDGTTVEISSFKSQDKVIMSWLEQQRQSDSKQILTGYKIRYRDECLCSNDDSLSPFSEGKDRLSRRRIAGNGHWSMEEFGHLRRMVAELDSQSVSRSDFWTLVREKMHLAGYPPRTEHAYRHMNYRFKKLISQDLQEPKFDSG